MVVLRGNFLAPSLPPPHFSRMVQNFEFGIYCLLKILANETDVQGMNMIFLDCFKCKKPMTIQKLANSS